MFNYKHYFGAIVVVIVW